MRATLEQILGDELSISTLRLLASIGGGMSGNAIARRLGRHQSSVRKALERLVTAGAVNRAEVGGTASYELNRRNALIQYCVLDLFSAERQLRELIIENVRTATQNLARHVIAVALYGSLARGERVWRDADILVVTGAGTDLAALDEKLADAATAIRDRFGIHLSARVVGLSTLMSAKGRILRKELENDGIQLHGRTLPRLKLPVRPVVASADL